MSIVDYSSSRALLNIIDAALIEKRYIYLVCGQKKVKPFLERQNILKNVSIDFIYTDREQALVDAAKKLNINI